MDLDRNQLYGLGLAALVGAGAWLIYTQSHKPAEHGVTIADLAQPNWELHPLLHYLGTGRLGAIDFKQFATRPMANCHPEAIQFAEGTISVSGVQDAPQYEELGMRGGGSRG